MKNIAIVLCLLLFNCLAMCAEQDAQDIVADILSGTSVSPVSAKIESDNVITDKVSAVTESELTEIEEPVIYTVQPTSSVENVSTNEKIEVKIESENNDTNAISEITEKTFSVIPGLLAGKTTDYSGKPIGRVKIVLFSTNSYKEMQSTPGGNFGFNIVESNEYTLTAQMENRFFHTNIFLVPDKKEFVSIKFTVPMNIYGQLFIDGKPAQYGLFLRLIDKHGGQAGGIVLSNGNFRIKNITPGRYTMVLERRKRFIDRRLNETRFYYVPITLTTETARVYINRDKRRLVGNVVINHLPRRNVAALVILKDAKTNGLLIHREARTYYNQGYFVFENIIPGDYILQAAQNQREWMSDKVHVKVKKSKKTTKILIDVTPDPTAPARRLRNLRKQFLDE